ncbi:MAG: TerB family tellurite resistance protein [Candidatus Marinimicrobia bacterium]|nr:TerB family tellurite resistance protein [Candidatus Neomarinimicrobiota bacterium]MBL7046961.1 TerB family tellurite resistance protein [Candidatus Neomarinimicrobiota bacterium]
MKMSVGKQLLWGGLGWVLAGPIGGIVGFTLATLSERRGYPGLGGGESSPAYPQTKPGDFAVSLLVLFAHVMKADKRLLRSELDYVKQFLIQNFGRENTRDLMILFQDILKQDYSLPTICRQVKSHMDHPSRLEMIHVLFGLSQADGHVHPQEIDAIHKIANYLGVSHPDFESIRAMFVKDTTSAYKILEIDTDASPQEIKRAYRKMANKYHPDKVAHLGDELKHLAEEKFKTINIAYQQIKKEQ